MTDIEINRSVKARPIQDVADQLGIQASELIPYGKLKAKVSHDSAIERPSRFASLRWGRYLGLKVEELEEEGRKSFRWKTSIFI